LNSVHFTLSFYIFQVTLQCAGNRRKDMHGYKPVQGLMWGVNAISTAEWTGVKLKDVLEYYGFDLKNAKHVQFEGLDSDPSGSTYGASIPAEKVTSDLGDVLIAFKMNNQDIPLDHGYPLRLIAPGIIGARSVKWLSKIIISDRESSSHWQRNDYKLLSPNVNNLNEADFSKVRAIQESPIQSAICEPQEGVVLNKEDETFTVKGYAYSGGGNSIESVMISLDEGKTWKMANLKKIDQPLYR
jgi:sulfite oxidase